MKPQSLVLLLLIAALGGGAWYFARSGQTTETDEASGERSAETQSGTPTPDEISAVDLEERAATSAHAVPSRRAARIIELRDEDVDSPAASFDGPLRTVLVEVEWPDEARPTGPVDVFVFDRTLVGGNVLSAFDSVASDDDEEPSERSLMFAEFATDYWTPSRIRASVLATAPVMASDGDEKSATWLARLEIPAGAGRTFAHVLGSTYITASPAIIDPAQKSVRITPARGAQLNIEVVADDGLDASHVEFHVSRDQSAAAMLAYNSDGDVGLRIRGETDENGTAVLGTVPAGVPIEVRVKHDDAAPARASVDALIPGTTGFVRLHLRAGATAAGICQTAEGVPVAGAKVSLYLAGRAFGFDDDLVRDTTSDSEGRFELRGIPDGAVVVRANSDNLLESKRELLTVENGEAPSDLVLVLNDGRSISGRVVDESGRAVPGAQVEARFDLAQDDGTGQSQCDPRDPRQNDVG